MCGGIFIFHNLISRLKNCNRCVLLFVLYFSVLSTLSPWATLCKMNCNNFLFFCTLRIFFHFYWFSQTIKFIFYAKIILWLLKKLTFVWHTLCELSCELRGRELQFHYFIISLLFCSVFVMFFTVSSTDGSVKIIKFNKMPLIWKISLSEANTLH